jgi:peptidoglycan hydrolase-like protein with peptidoglycan-binding domain
VQQSQAQVQQSQVQLNEQKNQPGQNHQAAGPAAGGPVSLGRDQVRQAQMLLREKGFDVGEVDGVLGPRTRRALIAFQRRQGLEASGQIDQRTAGALGLSNGPTTTSGHSGAGAQ